MPTRALQRLQLDAHLLAQLGIERGERLVEQQHVGLEHQRAGQRHALPLAARKLRRAARPPCPLSSTSSSASRTRARCPRGGCRRSPNSTFPRAVRCGNRA